MLEVGGRGVAVSVVLVRLADEVELSAHFNVLQSGRVAAVGVYARDVLARSLRLDVLDDDVTLEVATASATRPVQLTEILDLK